MKLIKSIVSFGSGFFLTGMLISLILSELSNLIVYPLGIIGIVLILLLFRIGFKSLKEQPIDKKVEY